jgi:hypothetical protein
MREASMPQYKHYGKKGTAVRRVFTKLHGKEWPHIWQTMKKTHGKDIWTAKTPQDAR